MTKSKEDPPHLPKDNILSIQDPRIMELSHNAKRRASQVKKAPRVIGANIEKKKNKEKEKDKAPRFAKRSSSPTVTKTSQNQMSLFDFTSSMNQKKLEAEKPIFDFSSAQDNGEVEESAFDFASADIPSQPVNNDSTSAFNFGEPENAQQNDNAGNILLQDANHNNHNALINNKNENENDNLGSPTKDDSSPKPDEMVSEENISESFENESGTPLEIVKDLKTLKEDVQRTAKQCSKARNELKTLKPGDIPAAKQAYQQIHDHLLSLLDNAIEMSKDAPSLLTEREVYAKNQIPILQKQKEETNQKLSNLEIQQSNDKESLANARKSTEATISSINRAYDIQMKSFSLKRQQHEQKMNNALSPITERLAEIEGLKSEYEKKIQELMQKIQEYNNKIAQLDQEYEEKMQAYESIESSFNGSNSQMQEEEKQLQEQRAQADAKIQKIEAPYQALADAVEKRQHEINTLAKHAQDLDILLSDSIRDTNQCSSVANIVNNLVGSHASIVNKRIESKKAIEAATAKLQELLQLNQPKEDEIQLLRNKSSRAAEIVQTNTDLLSTLDAEKKTAISQKNFMAAKQITQQIKDIQDQLNNAQKTVADSEALISKYEEENYQINSQIRELREEIEDTKYSLLENDFNYFESTIATLDGIFELSPFGEKLLKPLQSVMLVGLEGIERPPKLDPKVIQQKIDELNVKLDKVVAEEDYEAADTIQEQINRLTTKLAHST